MTKRLEGKRILVTQADDYMGPAIIDMFSKHGAEIIEDRSDLTVPDAAAKAVSDAGHVDVLMANLAADARFGVPILETDQEAWSSMFDIMVHPLHRLTQTVLPQMIERRKGKIIVVGSATGLRGMAGVTAYSSARHAQVGYIRSTALEVAQFNVQLNLIAQNWVENPAYFPPEFVATPEFQEVFKTVPMPRLATPEEDALFALFLASDESDFFVGQAIPFSGGWVQQAQLFAISRLGNLDFNLLSGRVNASDVLQEAFLDMAKELPAYRDKPDQHLIPWAWKDDQTSEEQKWFAEAREFQKREMDYFSMHVQKPTTPVFALADSPVGLAAWILEKFYIWSDHNGDLTSIYSMEDLATFVMM